jgi:hypothetical protein
MKCRTTSILPAGQSDNAQSGPSIYEAMLVGQRPDEPVAHWPNLAITQSLNHQMARFLHHRIRTAPQVTPAPKADIRIKSPFLMRPLRTHSSRQMGMEADDVFPMRLMFE